MSAQLIDGVALSQKLRAEIASRAAALTAKGKQLTNVRASGTDEAVRLVPPVQLSLEYAVEFIRRRTGGNHS